MREFKFKSNEYDKPIEIMGAYNICGDDGKPYKIERISPKSRKTIIGEYENDIYNLMREQFDRVVYILENELDIKIKPDLAQDMLQIYVKEKGWLYPWSTLNNLPWMLGYFSLKREDCKFAKNLYKQPVLRDSSLYKAIVKSCSDAKFIPSDYDNYDILDKKCPEECQFYIEFRMMSHERIITNSSVTETLELSVREPIVFMEENPFKTENHIFKKKLTINEKYFNNLISLPEERSKRNVKLLEIAKEVMPELP